MHAAASQGNVTAVRRLLAAGALIDGNGGGGGGGGRSGSLTAPPPAASRRPVPTPATRPRRQCSLRCRRPGRRRARGGTRPPKAPAPRRRGPSWRRRAAASRRWSSPMRQRWPRLPAACAPPVCSGHKRLWWSRSQRWLWQPEALAPHFVASAPAASSANARRRAKGCLRGVGIGARAQQRVHYVAVGFLGGDVQRRRAVGRPCGVGVGAGPQQRLHNGGVAVLGGGVQRRRAIVGRRGVLLP